jgi:putative transposase
MRKQCDLLGINRSTIYYEAKGKAGDDVELLNEIRDIWEKQPFYGYRKITHSLKAAGWEVNHKRVQRLMKQGGIHALYAKPRTSVKDAKARVYPYLLKGVDINRPNQAWQVDITYLRHGNSFMYLVALIDMYSRYVVGWSLSNTLDTESCINAVSLALANGSPEVINSDQGCQFTSELWISCLLAAGVNISMTGKGRCIDNIFIERFWRSFKQEAFYLNDYGSMIDLKAAIAAYVHFYNHERWHQALAYRRPAELYFTANRDKSDGVSLMSVPVIDELEVTRLVAA